MILDLFEASRRSLEILRLRGKTVAFSESCTGGLIAKSLTDHSGASAVFECGVVSYSGKIKHRVLGVPQEILTRYGEVSSFTAKEMADGIRALSGADIGIGVTGIAGPDGGTPDKPVGLIFTALSTAESTDVYKLELYDLNLTRQERRNYTACFVHDKIIELLK